eukprot:jgi/Botrbrau1/1680/Bobra.116_2s0024.1
MGCGSIIVSVLTFLAVLGACAVPAIIAVKLQHVHVSIDHLDVSHLNSTTLKEAMNMNATCLMWAEDSNQACIYGYTVAGVSLLASLLVAIFQCVTCNLCGCGSLLDFIFAAAACAWWAAASLLFGKYATQANEANLPEAQWRGWVIIISWAQAALFVLIATVSLIRIFGRLCGGGRRDQFQSNTKHHS